MRKGLFIVMGLMGLSVLLSSCSGYGSRKHRIPKIESFEILTLSETGMRGNTEEWEIQKTEEGAVYTRYSGAWRFNDDVEREDCIVFRTEGDEAFTARLLEILNDCKVGQWNGFSGPNPKGVRDGTMFDMNGYVNDHVRFSASGSNNYPKEYREFKNALKALETEE